MKIAMSSGHAKYVRGASGSPVPPQLDEVDQARRVVDRVAEMMKQAGVGIVTFHDNTSHSQNENLNTIVAWHNKQTRDWDISCHFNAFDPRARN
jgi:N-acetylmuramoyl-L-alanine amidase